MLNNKADQQPDLEKLRGLAAALEAQRAILGDGDEAVETTLAMIQAKITALEARVADSAGNVEAGQDVTGPDRIVQGDEIKIGDIKNAHGVAIGDGAQAQVINIYPNAEPEDEAPLRAYLQSVARRSARLPLGPLDPSAQESAYISLAQVFVGLDAGLGERPAEEDNQLLRYTAALGHIHNNPRLILLGDPGSGKSTLLRFLALCLAQAALAPESGWLGRLSWPQTLVTVKEQSELMEMAPGWETEHRTREDVDREDLPGSWTNSVPIPIYVTLRDLDWENAGPNSAVYIWRHIANQLVKEDLADAVGPLRRQAQAGQVIFLLDGVDEVPLEERAGVWRAIANMAEGAYGGSRWLATCRILSFEAGEAPGGVPNQTLQPLNRDQVNDFISRWYKALGEAGELSPDQTVAMTNDLLAAARRPRLQPLAQNPMLLTIMALVQTYHGTLPDQRAKLYQACVETLLLRWQRHKEMTTSGELMPEPLVKLEVSQEKLERLLWQIAWKAHGEAAGREGAADIPEGQVVEIAREQLGSYTRAEAFLEYTEQRAHLLIARGGSDERVYAFPHRTFQEYLAACHLAVDRRFPQKAADLAADPGLWREPLNLATGFLVFNQNNRERALDGVEGVLPGQEPDLNDEAGWTRVWLAGEMLAVVGVEAAGADELGRALLPKTRDHLAALLTSGRLTPRQRAEAGEALGQLGDPRPGVCDREPDLISIPAGRFLMGEERYPITLAAYAIARYPITHAQYRSFVEDGGYQEKWRSCWSDAGWAARERAGWSEPRYWQSSGWSLANKPVVGISWYEALAYCNWLSQDSDRSFRLPTEAEWERAARHTDGRQYPWGDEWIDGLVNSREAGIGRTTVVGSFPGGAAVSGAQDMLGNVWEWCQSRYQDQAGKKYPLPYRADDGREELSGEAGRILRGGAFDDDQLDVRAAVRSLLNPEYWLNDIGFRVVEHLS